MQTPQEIVRTQFPDSEQVRADQKQAERDRQWNLKNHYNLYCIEFDRTVTTPRQQEKNRLGSAEGEARQDLERASKRLLDFVNSQEAAFTRAAALDFTGVFKDGAAGLETGNAIRAAVVEAFQKEYSRLQGRHADAVAEHEQAMATRDAWDRSHPVVTPLLFNLSTDWAAMHA